MSLPLAPTLKGVVVGLDALADGLLQVSLLHTLDPQVLKAVVSQASVLCLQQSPFLPPTPKSIPLGCNETPSLPVSKPLWNLAKASLQASVPPLAIPKPTKFIPSSRSLDFFLEHGIYF